MCDQPTTDELAFVGERLHAYNLDQTAGRYDEPGCAFGVVAQDADGQVVGGVEVSSGLGVVWLEVLWVAEHLRRHGLASWLVLEAERIAHGRGCVGAGTWTFSWQAPEFYPTIGYRLNGIFDGYPFGITEHVLSKRLPDLAARRRIAARTAVHRANGLMLNASPSPEQLRVAHRGLHEFCRQHVGAEMSNPGITVRLVLRDDGGRVVGGLDSYTTIRIMALEAIWLEREYRGQGLGRQLLTEAERIAEAHGCVAVSSHCLSFQAPSFFHRLGYNSFGQVDVYPDGYTEDLLIKRL